MNKRLIIGMMLCLSVFAAESVEPVAGAFTASAQKDSLTPYTQASEVPQTALELWKDYDPRQENLEVKIHHEWKQDGVVSRLISFKVGTFKGSDARIAAYYCFPENGEKNPFSQLSSFLITGGTSIGAPVCLYVLEK